MNANVEKLKDGVITSLDPSNSSQKSLDMLSFIALDNGFFLITLLVIILLLLPLAP